MAMATGGAYAWSSFWPVDTIDAPDPGTTPRTPVTEGEWRSRLTEARRTCRIEPLEALLGELRSAAAQAEAAPKAAAGDDAGALAAGRLWDLVAASELELMLTLCLRIPWRVGAPMYDEVPEAVLAASERGMAALKKARELGAKTAEGFRVETALLSYRITGLMSALEYQPKINEAFEQAQQLDPDNPRLHVGLGCRKMFVPKFMGQDIPAALKHFEYASERLPRDERPALYGAMALYLLGKPEAALAMAEQAQQNNGDNPVAEQVVERLRAGTPDPFATDF